MGFFPNYDREGPGLPPDAPRRTGLPRFWEVLSRDFWDVFRAGFLTLIGCLPFFVGVAFSLYSHVLIFAPLFGLVGGALAGPELCALADTILRGLRDEPGFWWHTYRRIWKRSARASLLPGAVGGGLLAAQIFLLFHASRWCSRRLCRRGPGRSGSPAGLSLTPAGQARLRSGSAWGKYVSWKIPPWFPMYVHSGQIFLVL